jgi:DNA modification methylase
LHANGDRRDGGAYTSLQAARLDGRNARTVWTIATQPYSGAHFATMPEALAERCILAGSRPGDRILDPFGGSGTTARVALSLGRRAVVTELNPAYLALAEQRTHVTLGLPLDV